MGVGGESSNERIDKRIYHIPSYQRKTQSARAGLKTTLHDGV